MIQAYFACNDEMITIAGERSGAPGLDENRDTFWVLIEPREGYVFYPTPGAALNHGMENNLPYVYEARFEPEECVKAMNCALEDNIESLEFMTREILKLAAV